MTAPSPAEPPDPTPRPGERRGADRRRVHRRSGERRGRRRWIKRAVLGLLLLALLATAAAAVLTRPAVLTPFLRDQLASALRAEVSLERASLDLGGVLRLEGLEVLLPAEAAGLEDGTPRTRRGFRELLEVEGLTVRVSRRALLLGRLDLRRIEIDGPTLHAVLDGRHGRSNLRVWAGQFLTPGSEEPEDAGPIRLPPAIEVRDATLELVELGENAGGRVTETSRHSLPFDGTVIPRGEGALASLDFELAGGTPEGASRRGTDVSGRWTPSTQKLVLSVERMDLASPLGLLMPPTVRRYWRDMDPAGALPSFTLETRLDGVWSERLQRAELEVEGLSFRIPLESLDLLPAGESAEDAPRMSGVTGSVVVADGRVSSEGITGEVEGIRYRVAGSAPLGASGALDLVAETEPFEVPATPPLLFRLPGVISELTEEYRPSGRFAARIGIHREPGRPVELEGRVRAIDGRVVFRGFAYPLRHLEGDLLFARDRIELQGLAGDGPEGGRVVLDGTVTDPGPEAGIDLSIRVSGLPVDETLLGALAPDTRGVIRDLVSHETARSLADAAPPSLAGAGVEAFEPGGALNATVRVLRDTAVRPFSWVELDVDPEGLRFLLEGFAYPLTVRSGRLRTGYDEVRIEDVLVTGPLGGAGLVRGVVELHHDGSPAELDLRLTEIDLPIDRHLFAAIGEGSRWLRRLGLGGRVTGGGTISGPAAVDADGNTLLDWNLDLAVAGGRMALWGGDVGLAPVEADVRVSRDAVHIDGFTAAWPGGGTIDAEGRVGLNEGRLRLDFEGDGIAFDERVALLIPPESPIRAATRELLADYRLAGRADATVQIRAETDAAGGAEDFTVDVEARPEEVSGVYDERPVRFTAMTGRVSFGEDAALLERIAGRSEQARLAVSGRVPYDPAEATELLLDAEGPAADPALVALAPAAIRDAAAAVGLVAGVSMEGARLRLGPTPSASEDGSESDAPPLPFAFRGRLELEEVEASLGMPIDQGRITADVAASGDGSDAWPEIAAEVTAPSLRYADREVRSLRVQADNRTRPAVVVLRDLTAAVAGGRLVGGGEVRLGDDGRPGGPPPEPGSFAVDLRLDGAAAEPVLWAEEEQTTPADPPAAGPPLRGPSRPGAATAPPEIREVRPAGGRLWASLSAAGRAGLPDTLTGRGRLRVRGGDLLEGQWGVNLLRAINLGLPTNAPLGDADVRFVIVDGQVRLQEAAIRGEGLRLSGTGSVDFPSGEVYLTLFSSRETSRWLRLFQRLFDTIKDEFIGIEVSGTIWDPEAGVAGLAALRGEVGDRLGETASPRVVGADPPAADAGETPPPAVTTPPAR